MKWTWPSRKIQDKKQGLVGIQEAAMGISMAYATPNVDKPPTIKAYTHAAVVDVVAKQDAVSAFVAEHNLQGTPCTYVLENQDYTLTLVDTPNVAKEEMKSALQWLVRESISFPMTEAVIDSFELPLPRARDNIKISYVVIMRRAVIHRVENFLKPSGLKLAFIDIPELVFKNLSNLSDQSAKGVVLTALQSDGGKIMLCRSGMIYIARNVDLNFSVLKNPPDERTTLLLEQLSLEIQRSLDYSNNSFRQTIANSILLTPTSLEKELLEKSLKENLGLDLEYLDLNKVLNFEKEIKQEEQALCLKAIAAVLREEAA